MIIQERMAVYINSLDVGNGAFLDELEQEALRDDVPIIRQDMQSFLKVLLAMHQPKQILEVGTAVGFSALLMAAYIRKCVTLQRLKNTKNGSRWQRRIFKNPVWDIASRCWKAMHLQIMQELTGTYDMIFHGCSKGAVYSFSAGCAAASAHRAVF